MVTSTFGSVIDAIEIEAALIEANGKSRERLLDLDRTIKLINKFEEALYKNEISLDRIEGLEIEIDGCSKLPKSYGYGAKATYLRIRYEGGTWKVIEAFRLWNQYTVRNTRVDYSTVSTFNFPIYPKVIFAK